MKLYPLIAAMILLIGNGCVAYDYRDPYNSNPYPYYYNYNYGPYYYSPYNSGSYSYWPLIYPDLYLDFGYRGYHDRGHFYGHRDYRSFHNHDYRNFRDHREWKGGRSHSNRGGRR